jgi:hypothetical protein
MLAAARRFPALLNVDGEIATGEVVEEAGIYTLFLSHI